MNEFKIKSVYILGLGAIGSIYASKLHDQDPDSLKVIAAPERIEAYQCSGIIINDIKYNFNYVSPGETTDPADLIIIAVKYPDLQQAIIDIRSFVGKSTIVMSLLNGILSEEIIGKEIGMQHLLYAYTMASGIRDPSNVSLRQYAQLGKIIFGEANNEKLSSKVLAVRQLFELAGIPYCIPADMMRSLWSKFMKNTGINQVSTILEVPYSEFQHEGLPRTLMLMAAKEVIKISKACGINLNQLDLDEFVMNVDRLDPSSKTSMLQDIEAGRKTELENFSGIVIKLGKRYKIPTPINQTLYNIIKRMEQP